MSENHDPVFAIMDSRAIDDFDAATCMSTATTLDEAKREAPEHGDLCCVFKLVDGEEPEFIWQHGVKVRPAQPRSYRFDYKPGEWREPEQVVDESALASLEGKPVTLEPTSVSLKERVLAVPGVDEVDVVFNPTRHDHPDLDAYSVRVSYTGTALPGDVRAAVVSVEGLSPITRLLISATVDLPGKVRAIKVAAPFMTALPFPCHPDVLLDWDPETGVAVMTGPAGLFEPEHLTPGGRGTLGDEVLLVVEVNLTGSNREGATAKVTAQRGED